MIDKCLYIVTEKKINEKFLIILSSVVVSIEHFTLTLPVADLLLAHPWLPLHHSQLSKRDASLAVIHILITKGLE